VSKLAPAAGVPSLSTLTANLLERDELIAKRTLRVRVVLVHPAGSNWIPGKKDLTVTVNRMVPIGLLSIASYLEANGLEVLVHDCLGPRAPETIEANVARVLSLEPDLVGFSTTTSGFLDAYEMARRIRKARPAVKNVFGGIHVSGLGAPLMERFPEIDHLVLGEGEITLLPGSARRGPSNHARAWSVRQRGRW
jgi:radical SAM superfamily enzyme YgiQ (UPF0313 family)